MEVTCCLETLCVQARFNKVSLSLRTRNECVCVCMLVCVYLYERVCVCPLWTQAIDVKCSRPADLFCPDSERVVSLNAFGAISFDLRVVSACLIIAFDRIRCSWSSLFQSHSGIVGACFCCKLVLLEFDCGVRSP